MPRGRPPKVAEPKVQQVRLTPARQQPIAFDETDISLVCSKFAAFKEGGEATGPKLHYHCMFETVFSKAVVMKSLQKFVASGVNEDPNAEGNAVIGAQREAHEGTLGYTAKCGNCVYRLGYDEAWLNHAIATNLAYWRQREKDKKAKQRKDFALYEEVHEHLKKSCDPSTPVYAIVPEVLRFYDERKIRFPVRSQMEGMVLKFLQSVGRQSEVAAYYLKTFSNY